MGANCSCVRWTWRLDLAGPELPRLKKVWVDGAYSGFVEWARAERGWDVEDPPDLSDTLSG
jgi:hypothetical protein